MYSKSLFSPKISNGLQYVLFNVGHKFHYIDHNYLVQITQDELSLKEPKEDIQIKYHFQSGPALVSFCVGTCNFEVDTCDWSNVQTGDEIDWLRHSGSTGNANTGPTFDHTTGTPSGWYMYIDSARGGQGSRARFESSSIDSTDGVACFSMWYHMVASGNNVGTINVSSCVNT